MEFDMKASKEFFYTIIVLFFISLILSYFDFLLIDELVILRFELIFLAFWTPAVDFLLGYPLDIVILISLTIIAFYTLKYLGLKIR